MLALALNMLPIYFNMFLSTYDYRGGDLFNRKKNLKEFVENDLEVDNQCRELKASDRNNRFVLSGRI